MSRNVTAEPVDQAERFAVYRLCQEVARGERPELELLATCATAEAVGVTIVTLARESEFDGCPVGVLDRLPEPGQPKWLIKPWLPFPTPRQLSDAGRTLAQHGRKPPPPPRPRIDKPPATEQRGI